MTPIMSTYIYSLFSSQKHQKHISMDSNHKLAVLETAVLPITPLMHTKRVCSTNHTLQKSKIQNPKSQSNNLKSQAKNPKITSQKIAKF